MAKVLIVDDIQVEVDRLSDVVKSLGHTISVAMDGEEALEKIVSEKPDLVLLDVVMPKKNGFQVCREMRGMPEVGGTKVIMITSKASESDKFYGLKQGANEYLGKPYEDGQLVKLIKKFV
jgi:twitching motility two-component system response regulator PilH